MKKDINFDDVISYYKKRQEEAKKRFIQAKENKQDAIIEREEIDNLGNIINLFKSNKNRLKQIEKEYSKLQDELNSLKEKLPEGIDFTNTEEMKNKVDSIEKEIATAKEQFLKDHDSNKYMSKVQKLTAIKESLNQEIRSNTMSNIVKELADLESERNDIIQESNKNMPDEVELFKSSAQDELNRINEIIEKAEKNFKNDHDINKYKQIVQPLTERKEKLNQELRRIELNNYDKKSNETQTSTPIEKPVMNDSTPKSKEERLDKNLNGVENMSDEEIDQMIRDIFMGSDDSSTREINDDNLIIDPDKKSNFKGKISDIKPISLTTEEKEKINNYKKNKELKGKKWRKALAGAAGFAAGVGLNVVAGSVPVVGAALTVYAAGRTLYNTAKLVNNISTKLNHGEEPKIITSIKNKIPDKVKVACEKIFEKPKTENEYAKWFVNGMSLGYLADKVFDISGNIGKAFDTSNTVVPDTTPTPVPDTTSTVVPTETVTPIDNPINTINVGDSIDISTAEYGYVDSLGDGYTHLIHLDGFGKVDQIVNVNGQNMYSILQPNGQGYAWFTEEQVNDMINVAAKTTGKSL